LGAGAIADVVGTNIAQPFLTVRDLSQWPAAFSMLLTQTVRVFVLRVAHCHSVQGAAVLAARRAMLCLLTRAFDRCWTASPSPCPDPVRYAVFESFKRRSEESRSSCPRKFPRHSPSCVAAVFWAWHSFPAVPRLQFQPAAKTKTTSAPALPKPSLARHLAHGT